MILWVLFIVGISGLTATVHTALFGPRATAMKEGRVVVLDSDVVIEFPPEPIIPRKIDREQTFPSVHGHDIHPGKVGFDEVVITHGMRVSVR